MESRVAKIIANPYLDWRYSERPDITPAQVYPIYVQYTVCTVQGT